MGPAHMNKEAWFWSFKASALFVGESGKQYPESREVERCVSRTRESAADVFCRQIAPWAKQLIPQGKIPTLYFKAVWPAPKQNN